ncbi:carboxylesterase family protein [Streptomyces sp. TE12347]
MTDDPSRRGILRNTGVLTGAALLAGIPGGPAGTAHAAPSAGGSSPVVELPSGRLRGAVEGGLTVFKGVPYAAPPVGPLRWRPAQPHPGWAGTRDATAFGPSAPQLYREGGDPVLGTHGAPPFSEDCLTLNVWTPGGRRRRAAGAGLDPRRRFRLGLGLLAPVLRRDLRPGR